MNLGWLLLKNSGRQGSLKFIITMIAAVLGMLILLGVFSITHAFNDGQSRQSWVSATYPAGASQQLSVQATTRPGAVLVNPYPVRAAAESSFLGHSINVMEMYHTGGKLPEGTPLEEVPGPDEYYVSRGLDRLLREYDNEVFADRYPGTQAGIIDETYIQSPDELVMIRGVDKDAIGDPESNFRMNAVRVDDFTVSAFGEDYDRRSAMIITSIMAVGALGLILPVLILISTATRLGATEREKRYSALRLTGATKQQVRSIAFIDSLAASVIGIVIGVGTFWLLRPLMFEATFNGQRFYPETLNVQPLTFVLLLVVVFGLVWLTNKFAMRSVITSPLGVVRRQKLKKAPKAWNILPLLLGFGALVWLSTYSSTEAQEVFGPGGGVIMVLMLTIFLVVALGLVLAGAWVTRVFGSALGRVGRGAKALLVSRHIKHEARRIFRGVSGVVLAFFVGAFFITALGTVENYQTVFGNAVGVAAPEGTITTFGDTTQGAPSAAFVSSIEQFYDVTPATEWIVTNEDMANTTYVACKDAERFLGQPCEGEATSSQYLAIPGSASAIDFTNLENNPPLTGENSVGRQDYYLPKPDTTALDAERTMTALSQVDTGDSAIRLVQTTPGGAADIQPITELKALLYIGIVVTVIVASLSLVVATVAGLFDRKDSFATLRLTGADLPLLKRTVVLESMLPLVFVSALSIGMGIFFAKVFIQLTSTSVSEDFLLPEVGFWLATLAAVVISYIGIRLVLPMFGRLTDLETRRTE